MFDCFKKKERGPALNVIKKPDQSNQRIKLIVLIAGHTGSAYGSSKGMTTYNDFKEHDFNKALVDSIDLGNFNNHLVSTVILYRKHDSYSKYLKQIKRDIKETAKYQNIPLKETLVIEFHINASGIPEARGAEMLVADHKSAILAYPIMYKFTNSFNIKPRRIYRFKNDKNVEIELKGIKWMSKGKRGSGFLFAVKSLGCYGMLFEPFFGDFETEESKQFLNDPKVGIKYLSDFWVDRISKINLQ